MRPYATPQVRTVHFKQLGDWMVPLWLVTKLNFAKQTAELAAIAKKVSP
jgi:hypothetical protein